MSIIKACRMARRLLDLLNVETPTGLGRHPSCFKGVVSDLWNECRNAGITPPSKPKVETFEDAQCAVDEIERTANMGKPPRDQSELPAIKRAILILIDEPNLSNRKLAKKVGCDPSLFSKGENKVQLARMRESLAGQVRKGRKTSNGCIEAIDK